MRAGELIKNTTATYQQVDRWINHGCNIGKSLPRGETTIREFTELDARVCSVLASLAPLLGSGARAFSIRTIMRKVCSQLKNEPTLIRRKYLYISMDGVVHTSPCEGWVVAT